MLINPVIKQLRTYATRFGGRVSGAFSWDPAEDSGRMKAPCAWVVLEATDADENTTNVIRQLLRDTFSVYVVLPTREERGQTNAQDIEAVRADIFRALVGFCPAENYEPIQLVSGELFAIDRDRVTYRFEFVTYTQLGRNRKTDPADTWQEFEADGLARFEGVDVDVDFYQPDGQIEHKVKVDL